MEVKSYFLDNKTCSIKFVCQISLSFVGEIFIGRIVTLSYILVFSYGQDRFYSILGFCLLKFYLILRLGNYFSVNL